MVSHTETIDNNNKKVLLEPIEGGGLITKNKRELVAYEIKQISHIKIIQLMLSVMLFSVILWVFSLYLLSHHVY